MMSKNDIPIHPEKGLDPRLTYCGRCGCNTNEIIVGDNRLMKHSGGKMAVAPRGRTHKVAKELGWDSGSYTVETVPEGKLPSSNLCDSCSEEVTLWAKLVTEGGIYWQCAACPMMGVIKKSELADHLRESVGIKAPDPVSFQFQKCAEHEELGIKAPE